MKKLLLEIAIFILIIGGLLVAANADAAEVTLEATWAWSGKADTGGFKIYKQAGTGDKVLIWTGTDINQRSLPTLKTDIAPGRTVFYLTVYSADQESPFSEGWPYEYIELVTQGLPVPTVIIKFK